MRRIFTFWNLFWWNRHVSLARMHDSRIQKIDPNWRSLLKD